MGKNRGERKPRGDSNLKLLPEDQQERIWVWQHTPKHPNTLVKKLCWEDLGVKTSTGSLSDFYSWYGLKLDIKERNNQVAQLREDIALNDPSLTAEQIREAGTALLMSQALARKDGEAFAEAARIDLSGREHKAKVQGFRATFEQKERQLELDKEKFRTSLMSKLEAGLAALLDEIKGNARAIKIFDTLKAEVAAA